MRVLLLNQFFWPDSAATSQLLTDLARALRNLGHDVHAICADNGYALADDSTPNPGITIHRVKAVPFMRGKTARILSYISYFVSCAGRGLLLPRPDVVITLTTPPLLSLIGTSIKLLKRSKHFIWEMDLYPEVATQLGYFKSGGIIDQVTGALADYARKRCDGVIALGDCMRQRLVARGIPASKIHVAHNWADGKAITPLPRFAQPDRLVMLYSGNLGLAHDLATMAEALIKMKGDPRFQFVFAGGGALRKELEEICARERIASIEFRSHAPRNTLGESLSNCDIGLITQRECCLGLIVPSKIYGLLAAGRPVIFIGPKESTVAQIIERFNCGWQIDNGDSDRFQNLLELLIDQPLRLKRAGFAARQAFEGHYNLPIATTRICSLIGATPRLSGNSQIRQKASLTPK